LLIKHTDNTDLTDKTQIFIRFYRAQLELSRLLDTRLLDLIV